jgi:mono/diheme cytochrome c family protein
MLCLVVAMAGCKKESEPAAPAGAGTAPLAKAPAADIPPEAREEAKQIFSSRCAACHGANGAGDGAAAAAMNPKPRDYSDKSWQASVTDEQIEKVIVEGGPAVGKSALMPPNPDLASKPKTVIALRELIRSFGK